MRSSIIQLIVNCISAITRLGNIDMDRCGLADHSPMSSYLRYRQPYAGTRTEQQSIFGFERLFGTWRSLKPVPVVKQRPVTARPQHTSYRS